MKIKALFLIICCAAGAIQVRSNPAPVPPPLPAKQVQEGQMLPDYVVYDFFFRQVTQLETLADQKERNGKNALALRTKIQDDFMLDDDQARFVKQVAFDCLQSVADLDQQAKVIIAEARAKYPGGKLHGAKPPEPPVELKVLQAARNNVISDGRMRIKAALTDSHFGLVDELIKDKIAKGRQQLLPSLNQRAK